jgi:hypothetical protein
MFRPIWLKSTWILLFILPWIATLICLGVHQNRLIREIPVACVDMDYSASSRALLRQAEMLPQVKIQTLSNLASAQEEFAKAHVEAILIIEKGYSETLREGRSAHVTLFRQAGNSATSAQIQAGFASLIGTENTKLTAQRMIPTGLSGAQALVKTN